MILSSGNEVHLYLYVSKDGIVNMLVADASVWESLPDVVCYQLPSLADAKIPIG